jgi:hypothetical protein
MTDDVGRKPHRVCLECNKSMSPWTPAHPVEGKPGVLCTQCWVDGIGAKPEPPQLDQAAKTWLATLAFIRARVQGSINNNKQFLGRSNGRTE